MAARGSIKGDASTPLSVKHVGMQLIAGGSAGCIEVIQIQNDYLCLLTNNRGRLYLCM